MQSKRYYEANREKCKSNNRARQILAKYGLTMAEYKALFESHNHKCKICKASKKRNRKLAVDHDHKTGKIRGILCDRCNTVLGLLRDDMKLIKNMLKYLKAA